MTAQPGRPQAPFTSGELAPTLRERRDLKYYRSGAKFMQNVEVLPQGGFRYSGGSVLVSRVRSELSGYSFAGVTLSAPNGGIAANATDANVATALVTNSVSGAGPIVLLAVTFPAPVAVAVVDLTNFSCSANSGTVTPQWFDGANWHDVAAPRALTTATRSKRFAFIPGEALTAQLWRIAAHDLTGAMTITLGDVLFLNETNQYGNIRLRAFTAADGSETLHAFTAGNADVLRDSYEASYPTPHSGASIPALKAFQQLDTMMVFHQDVPPHRVLRQGSDLEWQSMPAPLLNIPNYDYGGIYGNGSPAVWQISMIGVPGDATAHNVSFMITVNGEEALVGMPLSGSVPDFSGFAANVQTAVLALPGVEPGVTAAYTGSGGSTAFIIVTFGGVGNGGDDWLVSMRADKADIACPAYRAVRGIKAGEAVISNSRGWPRCGIFYQQSMLMGGLRSLPNVWLKSETGNYFNFRDDTAAATGAMMVPMDSQGGEAIEEMVAGRTVLILSSLAEYFLADRAIVKTAAPNHVEASRHGARAGVPSVENEGAAIFVHKSGSVLYEFRYDEVGQTFVTKNLSILASHLLSDVSDMAVRRALPGNDANMLFATQPDSGWMATFALLREQDVTAGARRVINGSFVSVAAQQGSNAVAVVTARTVGGQPRRYVERLDPGGLLNQATAFSFDEPTDTLESLIDYIGGEVWAIADDDVLGPYTVPNSGTLTISQKAVSITIGRWTPPLVETLPPDRSIGPGVVLERRARIHTVRVSLIETTSLAIGANGGKVYDVPLFRFGDQMDVPALQHKFTGVIRIQGLTGFADQPTVVITQKRPGYLNVRGITIEADL